MGYLVRGYCHATIDTARRHLADLSRSGDFEAVATSSGVRMVFAQSDDGGVASSSQYAVRSFDFAASNVGVSPPVCDAGYEGGFVPWSPYYQDSLLWGGDYSLELVGEMWYFTFAFLGVAFVARSLYRIFL